MLGGATGRESACQCRRHKRHRLNLWVGKIPWRRARQPTPISLPGEPHGQRSLAGYSLWGCKEVDTTEHLSRTHILLLGFPDVSNGKESACNAGRPEFNPWVRKTPGGREHGKNSHVLDVLEMLYITFISIQNSVYILCSQRTPTTDEPHFKRPSYRRAHPGGTRMTLIPEYN